MVRKSLEMKKGQHTVLGEVMIFAIGLAIAIYVITNFNTLENRTSEITLNDHLSNVGNVISSAIVKSSLVKGSNITIEVPEKISDKVYRIKTENGTLILFFTDSSEKVVKKIFNINQKYVITGDVVSTARFIEISNTGTHIRLKKLK